MQNCCHDRGGKWLPEEEALGIAIFMINEICRNPFREETYKVGNDQSIDLETLHQNKRKHDSNELLAEYHRGFYIRFTWTQLDIVPNPGRELESPPDRQRHHIAGSPDKFGSRCANNESVSNCKKHRPQEEADHAVPFVQHDTVILT